MKRLFLLSILTILSLTSCGVIRHRASEAYLPGPAIRADYTPKGLVEEVQQPCSVPGPTSRRMIVYLPADYYQTTQRYPVFYLLHGARGYETSWVRKGKVYQTTDSLWRKGLAERCIVVMPNMNQYNNDDDYEGGRYKDAWESIWEVNGVVEYAFLHDVVQLVDSLYRTIPDKAHRAVAGLSIGGYQSIYIGANHPDEFGYIGAFSPYMWCLGKSNWYRRHFYGRLYCKLQKQFGEYEPEGYYLYAGKTDIMRPSTLRVHLHMQRKGYPHTYSKYPSGHDWVRGWIDEYADMLGRVFKTPEQSHENSLRSQ